MNKRLSLRFINSCFPAFQSCVLSTSAKICSLPLLQTMNQNRITLLFVALVQYLQWKDLD